MRIDLAMEKASNKVVACRTCQISELAAAGVACRCRHGISPRYPGKVSHLDIPGKELDCVNCGRDFGCRLFRTVRRPALRRRCKASSLTKQVG
jgi:hypothetical protein